MDITITDEPRLIIAGVNGRFDAHTVAAFTTAVVDRVGAATPNVIVDLAGVEFMDSSALASLVTTLKRTMEHGGEIVLAAIPDTARIILELTRLDQVFDQATTVDEARQRIGAVVR